MRVSYATLAAVVVCAIGLGGVGTWVIGDLLRIPGPKWPSPETGEPLAARCVYSDPRDEATMAALDRAIDLDLVVDDQPLTEALERWAAASGLQFLIDKQSLNDGRVSTDSPVTSFAVRDVSAHQALMMVLEPMALEYRVQSGVIIVETEDRAKECMVMREYELFSTEAESNVDYESLFRLVTTMIEPDSWNTVGGGGSIATLSRGGRVVVVQTELAHREIRMLLADLDRGLVELGGRRRLQYALDPWSVKPSRGVFLAPKKGAPAAGPFVGGGGNIGSPAGGLGSAGMPTSAGGL